VAEQEWTLTSSIAVTLIAVENRPGGAPTERLVRNCDPR
jgi:hypothetical protein